MAHDTTGGRSYRGPGPEDVPHALILNLFNSVSDGVLAVDTELQVIAVNEAALETLGLGLDRAMGRDVTRLLEPTDEALAETLRDAYLGRMPVVDQDLEIRTSRGRVIPVRLSTSLLRDPDGKILGCGVTFRNLVETRRLVEEIEHSQPFENIVTGDPSMRRLFGMLPTLARADSSLLLLGETGTGKSLLVKTLHNLSPRRKRPLITVNCAALPENLLEAELFGVRAGAFTGATRDRPGRLAAANGGTLFLDEIGDIPLGVQVKLLRVLQERVYERLGDVRPVPCDVRFVAATHRDLEAMCEAGEFRRDLYYRINVLNVEMPPLRERKGDIPLLIQRFLDRMAQGSEKSVTGMTSRVLEILTAYDYPGNIRELENIVEHAWVMCRGGILEARHLPRHLVAGGAEREPPAGAPESGLSRLEAEYISQVIRKHEGNRAAAAAELGIHRTTLQRKIRRLGIRLPPGDGRSKGPRRPSK